MTPSDPNKKASRRRTCGLIALASAALLSSSAAAQKKKTAHPVFEDGQAQVVKAFKDSKQWIRHDLWVEASFDTDGDGKLDRMHVDVTRQKQTDTEDLKVAVIYGTSPYYTGVAGGGNAFFWDPKHELGDTPPVRSHPPEIKHQSKRPTISRYLIGTWLPRGFAVVHSSSPGTGLSQGCPTVGGENEALAPKAVIDWLCGRAKGYTTVDGMDEVLATWCNGSVGMTGTSYEGTLPLAAATTGVEGLKAIIPVSPNTSYYHYYRSNGLIRHPGGYMGEDVDVLYDFIHSGYPDGRAWCNENVRDTLMMEGFDRLKGDYNDFWAGRDYLNQLDKLKAAVLIAHGFNDWNVMPAHSVRVYEALKAKGLPVQAYFHQGGHGGDPTSAMVNRWFSHYLYGVDNGVEDDPRSFIVRTGDKRSAPTAYAEYPHPDAELVELHPGKGGAKQGSLGLKFDGGNRAESFTDDVAETGTALAQAKKSKHRLLYATKSLREPLHLSGTSRLRIRMHADAQAANLSVWLVSLPWKEGGHINDNLITRGWADPQNHSSLRESSPLVPGEYVEFTFDLQPDDQIIPKGQSIGLMIFSSDRDFTLWPEAGTELTVDLDATALELAVVGGADAVRDALGK